MVVPSKYASKGHTYGDVHVSIHGHCEPAQWVPLEYCAPQFHTICASGKDNSVTGSRRFGHNGCQHFKIELVKHRNPIISIAKHHDIT